jgi:hypothetical protein
MVSIGFCDVEETEMEVNELFIPMGLLAVCGLLYLATVWDRKRKKRVGRWYEAETNPIPEGDPGMLKAAGMPPPEKVAKPPRHANGVAPAADYVSDDGSDGGDD